MHSEKVLRTLIKTYVVQCNLGTCKKVQTKSIAMKSFQH